MIRHVWFDLSGTLAVHSDNAEAIKDRLRYETYAEVVGKPVTKALKREYENLLARHGSNSAVFRSLGKPSNFWERRASMLDKGKIYKPSEAVVATLRKLKNAVPISLFTNAGHDEIRETIDFLGIDIGWFTFIISGDDVKERKPEPHGFMEMIKRSKLPPHEILYVGDRVNVDILPAKKHGMKTCLVWGRSEEADYSFERFEDILSIFKRND